MQKDRKNYWMKIGIYLHLRHHYGLKKCNPENQTSKPMAYHNITKTAAKNNSKPSEFCYEKSRNISKGGLSIESESIWHAHT